MTVGIVGLGLIGGSFAMALRADRPGDRILVAERSVQSLDRARLFGLYDGLLEGALSEVDILLLALYPRATVEWLTQHASEISPHTVVVDCAGIKREICEKARALASKHGFCFVGGHPMAGREVWGFGAARDDLFIGASMILTPKGDEPITVLSELKAFFLSLGFSGVTFCTADDHDRIIAYTSQLAHVLSSAYISSPTAEEHRGFSAGSFRDMTRVAAINAEMWSEILVENSDALLGEIDRLIEKLGQFRKVISDRDEATLREMLAEGAARKKQYGS